MKIKGTTIIELTDINTGEKIVTEDNNFMTNALHDLCQPILRNQNVLPEAYFYDEETCTVDVLMKGLLLFDTPLEEDPNKYFAPTTAKMIGHGGGVTYSGADLTLGSYNESQSSSDTNERTYVWDFTPEQANGIISSVCLTTMGGGIIGYGANICPEENGDSFKSLSNIHRADLDMYFSSSTAQETRIPIFLSFKNDELILCNFRAIRDGSLELYKVKIDSTSIDIFKGFQTNNSYNNSYRYRNAIGSKYTSTEEVSLDLTTILGNGNYFGIAQDGKYLYLTSKGTDSEYLESGAWHPNEIITILKYDLEEFTYETFSVTNTTSVPLAIRVAYSDVSHDAFTFGVADGYLFVREWVSERGDSVAELYAINLLNSTDIIKVQDEAGNTKLVGTIGPRDSSPFTMNIQGKVGFVNKSLNPTSSTTEYSPLLCVSTKDFIARYLNTTAASFYSAGSLTNRSSYYPKAFPTDNDLYFGCFTLGSGGYSESYSGQIHVYPNMLMTINNLLTPVEKTPAQSMRVIYKITKE